MMTTIACIVMGIVVTILFPWLVRTLRDRLAALNHCRVDEMLNKALGTARSYRELGIDYEKLERRLEKLLERTRQHKKLVKEPIVLDFFAEEIEELEREDAS